MVTLMYKGCLEDARRRIVVDRSKAAQAERMSKMLAGSWRRARKEHSSKTMTIYGVHLSVLMAGANKRGVLLQHH